MVKINNFKIGKRLAIGFTIIILIMSFAGVYVIDSLNTISKTIDRLTNHAIIIRTAALEIDSNILMIQSGMKDIILVESHKEIDLTLNKIKEYDLLVDSNFELIGDRFLGDKAKIEKAYKSYQEWEVIREETIRLVKNGDKENAIKNVLEKENCRQIK